MPEGGAWSQYESVRVLVQPTLDQRIAEGLFPQRPNQALLFLSAKQGAADAVAGQLDGRVPVQFELGGA